MEIKRRGRAYWTWLLQVSDDVGSLKFQESKNCSCTAEDIENSRIACMAVTENMENVAVTETPQAKGLVRPSVKGKKTRNREKY